jgi:hypothetical protein
MLGTVIDMNSTMHHFKPFDTFDPVICKRCGSGGFAWTLRLPHNVNASGKGIATSGRASTELLAHEAATRCYRQLVAASRPTPAHAHH